MGEGCLKIVSAEGVSTLSVCVPIGSLLRQALGVKKFFARAKIEGVDTDDPPAVLLPLFGVDGAVADDGLS